MNDISSFTHLGDTFDGIEDKLNGCEDSLKQSFEQVSDIKEQAASFQGILLASSGDEKWKDNKEVDFLESNFSPDLSAEFKMFTLEQNYLENGGEIFGSGNGP